MSAQVASHNGAEEEFIEERQKDSEGRIFTKKYIKGRLLGKGGFAKVFLAHSLPNKTPYAFKIVQKSSLVKDRARRKVSKHAFEGR
jgi:serine/threonine protein kinase